MEECLRRSIVQLDLLKPGETYRIKVNDGRYSRDEEMELIACYTDYYQFINGKGFMESFLKSDLFSGAWEVEGFNPREKLFAAAGKIQEAAEVKKKTDTRNEVEEEVERIVRGNTDKMVQKVINWLNKNPGQPGDVSRILIEHNPSQYYVDKVRNEAAEKLEKEGHEIKITNTRPKYLILKPEENESHKDSAAAAAETVNALNELTEEEVENIEVEEESEIEMTQEKQLNPAAELSGDVVSDPTNNKLHATVDVNRGEGESISDILRRVFSVEESDIEDEKNKDRKFLIEKAEELQLRITDSQERLDQLQTRLTAEIDIYQELLEEIQEHLEA